MHTTCASQPAQLHYGPAAAGKCRKSYRAVSCLQLGMSAPAGQCSSRHLPALTFRPGKCRRTGELPGAEIGQTCVACRSRQYSGKMRLFRAPDSK